MECRPNNQLSTRHSTTAAANIRRVYLAYLLTSSRQIGSAMTQLMTQGCCNATSTFLGLCDMLQQFPYH